MHFYVVGYYFERVHFFTVRWTVQSIYAIVFFFMIFQQVWLLVACLTQLTFCVSVLYMFWHYVLFVFSFFGSFFMALSNESILKVLCTALGGVSHDSLVDFLYSVYGCWGLIPELMKYTRIVPVWWSCERLHYYSI